MTDHQTQYTDLDITSRSGTQPDEDVSNENTQGESTSGESSKNIVYKIPQSAIRTSITNSKETTFLDSDGQFIYVPHGEWYEHRETSENSRVVTALQSFLNIMYNRGDIVRLKTTCNGHTTYYRTDSNEKCPLDAFAETWIGEYEDLTVRFHKPLPGGRTQMWRGNRMDLID